MTFEQSLADVASALRELAVAVRENTLVGKEIAKVQGDTTPVGATSDNPNPTPEQLAVRVSGGTAKPETIIVDEQPINSKDEAQPITGNNPDTVIVDEIAAEVTYDEMRSAFMKVPSKCGADVAREILAKFSCTKVPQVPAEHYAEVKRLSEEALAKVGK